MKNLWYLYLIRTKEGMLYTGITNDVIRRFNQHCTNKGAKYLRGKQPLTLEYWEYVGDRSEASKRELQVKKLSKNKKEAMISRHYRL